MTSPPNPASMDAGDPPVPRMPSSDPSGYIARRSPLLPWRSAWQRDAVRGDVIAGTTLAAYAVRPERKR